MVLYNSKSDLPLAILLEHMHKNFEINRTKIMGGCQSGRKVVTHNSKSDLLLDIGTILRCQYKEYLAINSFRAKTQQLLTRRKALLVKEARA